MAVDTARVERQIRARHGETLAGVEACAADVVAGWDGSSTTDPERIREDLRTALRTQGVMEALPDVLLTAIDATGYELPASPVPAPPYVTVTSVGPVLRGTLSHGRVVITIEVFQVVDQEQRRYRRVSQNGSLTVEWVEQAGSAAR